MAHNWLRLWHDMPTDPKFRVVARASKQPLHLVIALYVAMLVDASANEADRGLLKIQDDELAVTVDCDPEQVSAVREAMQGRLLEGDRVRGWDVRQPAKDDSDRPARATGNNYIYYVVATDSDVVRVAVSRNPWARLKDLKASGDGKYALLATLKTDADSESGIADFFAGARTEGGWMKRTAALNSLISKTASGELSTLDACLSYLAQLPQEAFNLSVDNYRSDVATTKDKDTDKDTEKKVNPSSGQSPDGAGSVPAPKAQTKKHTFTPEDKECAEWILGRLLASNPGMKRPKLDAWANDVRLMREIDGRTHRDICGLFAWANQDPFWSANILSIATLREKWDRLAAKARQSLQPASLPAGGYASRQQQLEERNRQVAQSWVPPELAGKIDAGGVVIDGVATVATEASRAS